MDGQRNLEARYMYDLWYEKIYIEVGTPFEILFVIWRRCVPFLEMFQSYFVYFNHLGPNNCSEFLMYSTYTCYKSGCLADQSVCVCVDPFHKHCQFKIILKTLLNYHVKNEVGMFYWQLFMSTVYRVSDCDKRITQKSSIWQEWSSNIR